MSLDDWFTVLALLSHSVTSDSALHGLQAPGSLSTELRILEWIAISYSCFQM